VKLLHVITTLDVGGAEMHLLSQVRGQCAAGHSVRVAYLKGAGTLADDFRAAGAEWVGPLPLGLGFPFRLRRQLKWADVVHSHLLKADAATAVCATLFGKRSRLISGKHNDEQVLKRPLVSRVHGVLGNLPCRTIVLSDHVGRFIERYGRVRPERMTRIYYGLDPTPFEAATQQVAERRDEMRASFGFPSDAIVLICVARFAPQKAHDILLEGFGQAQRECPDLRLLLVGDDPFGDGRTRAEGVARELGLLESGLVHFAGIRRDVPELLAASDVFVMSSLWEGLGLVFLEAMATRLPVLSTNVSAIPEVVIDGETGSLVPPSDAEALAQGMVRLAESAELRAQLGEAGYARVRDRFSIERMVQETLAVYAHVAGRA